MRRLFRSWKSSDPATRLAVHHLANVALFKGLPKEEVEAMFQGVMVTECRPGTIIFEPEAGTERVFVLKEGQVELYRLSPSGKRLVTRRYAAGDVFGEMGLLGQSMQGCFAEATEESLICAATRNDILQFLQRHPEVTFKLLEAVGNRLRSMEDRLEHAVYDSVRERIAAFLLAQTRPENLVVTGYTHEDIGDTIGALRQTVTEELNRMQKEGILRIGHKQIKILDRQRLRQVTEGALGE